MACESCEWKDAAARAGAVADALPEFKTNRIEFFQDLESSISERQHVTKRQMEVIESAEGEVD